MPVIAGVYLKADLDRPITFKAGKVLRSFVAIEMIDGTGPVCFIEPVADNRLLAISQARQIIRLLDDGLGVGSGRRDSRVPR